MHHDPSFPTNIIAYSDYCFNEIIAIYHIRGCNKLQWLINGNCKLMEVEKTPSIASSLITGFEILIHCNTVLYTINFAKHIISFDLGTNFVYCLARCIVIEVIDQGKMLASRLVFCEHVQLSKMYACFYSQGTKSEFYAGWRLFRKRGTV